MINKNKYVEDHLSYKGMPFHQSYSKCGLRIHTTKDDRTVVILTDMGSLDENYSGTSITNSAEQAIKSLILSHSIDPKDTIFIEHYASIKGSEETFDRIIYSERQVFWKPMTKQEVDKLLEE